MDPFSISCTTCQARLKVRDAQIIGHILPCPKCGSMVMVEAPSPQPSAGGDAARAPAQMPPVAPVVSGSFDNIEQLLDDDPSSHHAAGSRWKQAESAAAAESANAPSPQVPGASSIESDGPADWLASSGFSTGRYAMFVGGALLGVGLAVGIAGYVLTSGPSSSRTGVPREEPAPAFEGLDTAVADAEATTDVKPVDEPIDADAAQLPTADHQLAAGQADANEPTDDAPNDSVDIPLPDQAADEDGEVADRVDSPAAEPGDQGPTKLATTDDDGLAGFARWLQDADTSVENEAPPPQPSAVQLPRVRAPKSTVIRPTRAAPKPINVNARLQDKIAALEFKDVSLINALRTLGAFSTIPITVDPNALGRLNLTAGRNVNMIVRETSTVAEILDQLLRKVRLGYAVVDGHLIVTTKAESEGKRVRIQHDLSDLVGRDGTQAEELANWVRQLVDYGSWKPQGGAGQLRVENVTFDIDHFDTVHFKVLVFCERLRIARGLPARTRIMSDRIELEPRVTSLRASADAITLRIWRDSNLETIAAELENAADVDILIDWQSLHHSGWSPQDRMKFFCQDQPLETALATMLEPMGLIYRVVDPRTIQITSPEAVMARCEVEFFRLPRGTSAERAQQLSEQIVQQLGPAQFQPAGPGSIGYDTLSHSLIVSLPQSEQSAILTLLPRDNKQQP